MSHPNPYYPSYRSDSEEGTSYVPSPGTSASHKYFDQDWFNSSSSSPHDFNDGASTTGASTAGYNVPSSTDWDTATTTDTGDVDEYGTKVDSIPPERADLEQEHGRGFHTFKEQGIYHLPADEEEWDRLGKFAPN